MTHDYKAALETMPRILKNNNGQITNEHIMGLLCEWVSNSEQAIIHALKLAEKVTGEPSREMEAAIVAAYNLGRSSIRVFQAGVAQAQKEIADAE